MALCVHGAVRGQRRQDQYEATRWWRDRRKKESVIAARAQAAAATTAGRSAQAVAQDEDFWFNVRHAFTVDRNIINLNNGGVSPAP